MKYIEEYLYKKS